MKDTVELLAKWKGREEATDFFLFWIWKNGHRYFGRFPVFPFLFSDDNDIKKEEAGMMKVVVLNNSVLFLFYIFYFYLLINVKLHF